MFGGNYWFVKKSERPRCRHRPLLRCRATRSKGNRGWFVGFRFHDSIIDKLRTVVGMDSQEKGLQNQISNRNQKPSTGELDYKDGLFLGHGLNDSEMAYRFQPIPIALQVDIKWLFSQAFSSGYEQLLWAMA